MSTKRYPVELKERAVRMVISCEKDYDSRYAAIKVVAKKLGVGAESLRTWVRKAEVDAGRVPGVTTAESEQVKKLEREVLELRRENEILKAAASFFARELDPPLR